MRTKKMLIAGLAVLAVSFTSNLQWSMQDYGLKSISLSEQLLAQGTTETGWWDKTTGAVSDWWKRFPKYSKNKIHRGITRIEVVSKKDPDGSIHMVPISEPEYLFECQPGGDEEYCIDSWIKRDDIH